MKEKCIETRTIYIALVTNEAKKASSIRCKWASRLSWVEELRSSHAIFEVTLPKDVKAAFFGARKQTGLIDFHVGDLKIFLCEDNNVGPLKLQQKNFLHKDNNVRTLQLSQENCKISAASKFPASACFVEREKRGFALSGEQPEECEVYRSGRFKRNVEKVWRTHKRTAPAGRRLNVLGCYTHLFASVHSSKKGLVCNVIARSQRLNKRCDVANVRKTFALRP